MGYKILKNNTVCIGSFNNNKQFGEGTVIDTDKKVSKTVFYNGIPDGIEWDNIKRSSDIIKEVYSKGILQKQTQIIYANGSRFVGQIQNGQPNGFGELIFKTHRIYCNFSNGEANGYGSMEFIDGTILTGNFEYGELNGNVDFHLNYIHSKQIDFKTENNLKWKCYCGDKSTTNRCGYAILQNNSILVGQYYYQFQEGAHYISKDDELGTLGLNNKVYFFDSGISATLDLNTGDFTNISQYHLHFQNTQDYLNQNSSVRIGTIDWDNGLFFEGQIYQDKPYYSGYLRTKDGQIYQNILNIAFDEKLENIYSLNTLNGELTLLKNPFNINNKVIYMDINKQNGLIMWQNGCCFVGDIDNYSPKSIGIYINENGDRGLFNKESGNVYYYDSGKFGKLNDSDGTVILKSYTIKFSRRYDYIKQSKEECIGIVQWANNAKYIGQIMKDKPAVCGEYFENGISYICSINIVFDLQKGDTYELSQQNGVIDKIEKYEQHQNKRMQFSKDGKTGIINWQNGSKYIGKIANSLPNTNGVLVVKDQVCVFYDIGGSDYILYRNLVYYPDYGNIGEINGDSGELNTQKYQIIFYSIDTGQFQSSFNDYCSNAIIKWPIGTAYQGKIRELSPTNDGFYLNSKGEKSIICNYYGNIQYNSLYSLKTNKVEIYKYFFAEIVNSSSIIIPNEKDFVQQCGYKCRNGYITWSNGMKYDGLLLQNKPALYGTIKFGTKSFLCSYNIVYDLDIRTMFVLDCANGEVNESNIKSEKLRNFTKQCCSDNLELGVITWNNGNIFVGQFKNNSPHSGIFVSDKQFYIYFENSIYNVNNHRFGNVNIDNGEIELHQYLIQFEEQYQYIEQLSDPCKGIIQWPNGNSYKGLILKSMPNQLGQFTSVSGDVGIFYRDIICFPKSGQCYHLDQNVGFIVNLNVILQFSRPELYFKHSRDNWVNGTLYLPNNIVFVGQIYNNQPTENGEFTNYDGVKGFLKRDTIIFPKSGLCGNFNSKLLTIEKSNNRLIIRNQQDYFKTFLNNCIYRLIILPNGLKIIGDLYNQTISKGKALTLRGQLCGYGYNEIHNFVSGKILNVEKTKSEVFYKCVKANVKTVYIQGEAQIRWHNGIHYKGLIHNYSPTIGHIGQNQFIGKISIPSYHQNCYCCNNIVYDKLSGNVYILNFETGDLCIQTSLNPQIFESGFIKWSNQNVFMGEIGGGTFTYGTVISKDFNEEGICTVCSYQKLATVYFPEQHQMCLLDMTTGEMKTLNYTLEYITPPNYYSNYQGTAYNRKGIIKWKNGISYNGEIYWGQPYSEGGEWKNESDEKGNRYRDILVFQKSGVVGHIDSSSGNIQLMKYRMVFANTLDYAKQYQDKITCKGQIAWQDGNKYDGSIKEEKTINGEFQCINGETGICYNSTVYFTDSGKFGQLIMETGEIEYNTHYTIIFDKREDYIQQNSKEICVGKIIYNNSNTFEGTIFQNLPCNGYFTCNRDKMKIEKRNGLLFAVNEETNWQVAFDGAAGELREDE